MWKSLWYNYRLFIKWNAATNAILLHLTTYVSVAKTWRKVCMYFCRSNYLASLFRGAWQKEDSHLTPLPVVYGFYECMIPLWYFPVRPLSTSTRTISKQQDWHPKQEACLFRGGPEMEGSLTFSVPMPRKSHTTSSSRSRPTLMSYSAPLEKAFMKKYYSINQGLWLNYIAHL